MNIAKEDIKRLFVKEVPFWWVILSSVIVLLLGTGAIWKYKEMEISKQNIKLSKAENAIKLHKEIVEIYNELILMINENNKLEKLYSANKGTQHEENYRQQSAKLDALRDAFYAIENYLAQIEEREPRNFNLSDDWIYPAKITNLEVIN
ncbi:MAG: hypothetical protein ABIE07_12655 [Candidatus Zixiibacteriota bacterium]